MWIKLSTNLGMAASPLKVVLDSNILVSALVFGGKPEQILERIISLQVQAIISPILISELTEVLIKKFKFTPDRIQSTEDIIKESFKLVYPSKEISILNDEDDNRVLEAAVEGEDDFIVTGDRGLLKLGKYRGVQIMTAKQFLARVN